MDERSNQEQKESSLDEVIKKDYVSNAKEEMSSSSRLHKRDYRFLFIKIKSSTGGNIRFFGPPE